MPIATNVVNGQFFLGLSQITPARGKILFTAAVPYVLNPTATPNPEAVILVKRYGVMDGQGYVCTPKSDNPDAAGERGLSLATADAPGFSPHGWTWRATPQFEDSDGNALDVMDPFNFTLLTEGPGVDLPTVARVPSSKGVGTEQVHALLALAQSESAAAHTAASDARSEATAARRVADDLVARADRGDFMSPVIGGFTPPALEMAPAEDIPEFTFKPLDIWSDAPSIDGSAGWYREKRLGADEKPPNVGGQYDGGALDLDGSTYFRYPALPAASDYGPNPGRIIISDLKPGGDAQYAFWLFNVEFVTTSPVVEFALNPGVTNGHLGLVLVDGKRVSERAVRHTSTNGTGMAAKMTFPTTKARTITVYGLNDGTGRFGGVGVAPGHTVTKPKTRPTRRIAFIGDSFVNGAGDVDATETFVWRLANLMGADEVLQVGIGGTGWAATPGGSQATRFVNRIPEVLAMNPDVIIFGGGRNDSPDGTQAAVAEALELVKGREVYVVSTASDEGQAAVNDAISAGAKSAGVPFIRANIDRLPLLDDVHLTYDAHQRFADELYTQIVFARAR